MKRIRVGNRQALPRRLIRAVRVRVTAARRRAAMAVAIWRRNRQKHVDYIGVTGSSGKSTALHLIAAALPAVRSMRRHYHLNYDEEDFIALIAAASRGARFAVAEFTASPVGTIEKRLPLVRPKIGVATVIGDDHYADFRGAENAAREKQKLIQALPPDGVAILNADDPLVIAMAEVSQARVVSYGTGPGADLMGREIAAAWPDRLSMTVAYDGNSVPLQTQLVGTQQTPSVLAALATAVAVGVPLADAAARIAATPPIKGRMNPIESRDGVTFLDDGGKATLWTLDAAFDVLRQARTHRKLIVLGHLSDYSGSARRTYSRVAKTALAAADQVIFVGPLARQARHGMDDDQKSRLHMFEDIVAARDFLFEMLRPGDLVLIKGSLRSDHLERLALAHAEEHNCWRRNCKKWHHCSTCHYRFEHLPR